VPVEQIVGDVRFDLARVGSLRALDVAGIRCRNRIDTCDEGDAISRRAQTGPLARRSRSNLAALARWRRDPELPAHDVRDPLPSGRPTRFARAGFRIGPLRELYAEGFAREAELPGPDADEPGTVVRLFH